MFLPLVLLLLSPQICLFVCLSSSSSFCLLQSLIPLLVCPHLVQPTSLNKSANQVWITAKCSRLLRPWFNFSTCLPVLTTSLNSCQTEKKNSGGGWWWWIAISKFDWHHHYHHHHHHQRHHVPSASSPPPPPALIIIIIIIIVIIMPNEMEREEEEKRRRSNTLIHPDIFLAEAFAFYSTTLQAGSDLQRKFIAHHLPPIISSRLVSSLDALREKWYCPSG